MKKTLAVAAACGALAVGVPAAIAATDAPDTANTPVQTATPAPDQTAPEQPRGDRPNGDDCPEKDGRGGGAGAGSNDNQGSTPDATATPDV
jgi:hypothetical protein